MKATKSSGSRIERFALAREKNGSIVLEAALVLPLLLFVLLTFTLLISLCGAQMALQSTASQSARQLASHIRPVELAAERTAEAANRGESASPVQVPLADWSALAADAAEWLPEPAGELISSALRGDWRPLQDMAATELGRSVIEPLIREQAGGQWLRPERIRLVRLTLPDLKEKERPYVGVALQYEYPVAVPFYRKPILLKSYAYERVWVSDAVAAAYGSDDGDSDVFPLQIVSIEPTPLRPGHKATVVALTKPGAVISLGVTYKSGASKARHLGEASADAAGYVQWTWHVSGNTTPGIWELTARESSGTAEISRHFSVEKKAAVP